MTNPQKSKLTKYVYGAKDKSGRTVTGTIEAADEEVARMALESRGMVVISIGAASQEISFLNRILNRVSQRELAVFARQLSTMVGASFPLVQALRVIILQTHNQKLKETLEEVVTDLEKGIALSSAFEKHLDVFDRVFVAVIKAGESSGTLPKVLDDMADEMEQEAGFSSRLRSALAYPTFVIAAMIVVGIIMMIKVVPTLQDIFRESNAQLPIATRILIGTSYVLSHFWWLVIIILAIIIIVLRSYLLTENGKMALAKFKLKVPVYKTFEEDVNMLRMTRTLSLLVRTGIPILEAIKITTDVLNNEVYKNALENAYLEVERGVPISVPLSKGGIFPVMIGQMVSVGEQTGKLESVLENLRKYYRTEVDRLLKTITAVLEPVLIVIVGLGVGIIVFAIIVPIYQLAEIGV